MKKLVLAPVGALVSGLALAAADVSAITTAQTDALSVAAAVAGLMIAVWAAKLGYRKFFGS